MNRIELADAQLARVLFDVGSLTLQLSTAPAWRAGEGADTRPVPGHLSGVSLVFDGAQVAFGAGSALGDCVGAVQEAGLLIGGRWVRELPVPGDWAGPLTLDLALRNGAGLQVQAQRLRLTLEDGGQFIDSMVC